MLFLKITDTRRVHAMAKYLKSVSSSQAWSEGADLWVISDSEHSFWNYKIDWQMGFHIRKYRSKKIEKINIPSSLDCSSLDRSFLSSFNVAEICKEFLMESSYFLPNLWTLEVPYKEGWLDRIYTLWEGLNKPRLRIFPPDVFLSSSSTNQFEQELREKWKTTSVPVEYVI